MSWAAGRSLSGALFMCATASSFSRILQTRRVFWNHLLATTPAGYRLCQHGRLGRAAFSLRSNDLAVRDNCHGSPASFAIHLRAGAHRLRRCRGVQRAAELKYGRDLTNHVTGANEVHRLAAPGVGEEWRPAIHGALVQKVVRRICRCIMAEKAGSRSCGRSWGGDH
jgi:hypothetical protein